MGFFDNVSKKKESAPSFMSTIPPPPPPEHRVKLDIPLPNTLPPPLPPPLQQKTQEKIVLSAPIPPPPLAPPAPLPVKKEDKPDPASNNLILAPDPFTLPNLPKRDFSLSAPNYTEKIEPVAPESLPLMPKMQKGETEMELSSFSDTYEEIPYFNQAPELEMLSSLKISDIEEEQNKMPEISTKGPLFIRTDNYSNVLTVVDSINDYIEVSSDTIGSIENLKKNAAIEHGRYKSLMEDIQRKLIYIDKVLFEKGVA